MSIYGPTRESTAVPDLSDYAKKEYVDTRDVLRMTTVTGVLTVDSSRAQGRDAIVAKTGQADFNMESRGVSIKTGNLALGTDAGGPDIDVLQKAVIPEGGIRIRNTSNTQQFQLGWNSSGNLELRHTEGAQHTTVCEVTPAGRIASPAIITVWAEENGSLNSGAYEWSFGDKSTGADHSRCGYIMMAPGRVLRMGLTANAADGTAVVKIVVNGEVNTAYGVSKLNGRLYGTRVFTTPLELMRGDRINFRTVTGNSDVSSAVVALLIELDM